MNYLEELMPRKTYDMLLDKADDPTIPDHAKHILSIFLDNQLKEITDLMEVHGKTDILKANKAEILAIMLLSKMTNAA